MSTGVAVLCSKRWPKSINSPQRTCVSLRLELSTDRQKSRLVKKVVRVVHGATTLGQHFEVQRSDPKHFACTLTITGSDNGCIGVEKTILVKELMNRLADLIPDTCDGTKGVGSGSQVCPFPQLFKRMAFLLKRIGLWVCPPNHA